MTPRHDAAFAEQVTALPRGFSAIWTCVAIDLVGFGIVLPILPLYAERFGAGPAAVGLLVASFSLAQFVFAPLWGRVSDRVGRKPVLVVSLVGTAVGSLVTGLAGSLWVLFAGRIIDGISGASVSVAQAAVTDIAPPDQRTRLLGLVGAAFGIGFVAGPAIGGLAALGGPELPFFVAAAIAAANAVVALVRLPETHRRAAAPAAPPVAREPRRNRPDLVLCAAIGFLAMTAFAGFEATFALLGERRLGLTVASVGAVFAGIGIVLAVVQGGLVRPAVARLGDRGTLRLGLALNAVGLLLLPGAGSLVGMVPALLALTVGQGLAAPALTSLVAGLAGSHERGRVLGFQQAAAGLARVVGPVAGGVAFEHVGVPAPYVGGAVLLVVALGALGRLRSREPAAA